MGVPTWERLTRALEADLSVVAPFGIGWCAPHPGASRRLLISDHLVACDNAVMESFFSSVKSELGERFEAYGIAKEELFDYIEVFYNQQRRHSTLGQISLAAFEPQAAARQERSQPVHRIGSRPMPVAYKGAKASGPRR